MPGCHERGEFHFNFGRSEQKAKLLLLVASYQFLLRIPLFMILLDFVCPFYGLDNDQQYFLIILLDDLENLFLQELKLISIFL